MPLR
ncbi:hypothetical protein VC116063_003254A, partial [Vibrio cholerae O1 str. 116063]|jgi:hypothetical protein